MSSRHSLDARWETRARALGVFTLLALVLAVFSTSRGAPAAGLMILLTILGVIATATCLIVGAIVQRNNTDESMTDD